MISNNLIFFSIIYICIFSGFYLVLGFLSSLYPGESYISFILFNSCYGIFSLFSPIIISYFSLKLVLFICTITFLIYIGFIGSLIFPLFIVGSIIGGIGNAMIWLCQGVFLTSEEIGIFYSLFNINMIFGNLLGLIILLTNGSVQIMSLSMLAVTTIAIPFIFFISPISPTVINESNSENIDKAQNKNNENNNENKNEIKLKDILDVFLIAKEIPFILPLFIYQTLALNITYLILPILILESRSDQHISEVFTAVMYIVYGISAMVSSYLFGIIFDKYRIKVLIFYTLLEIGTLIGIYIISLNNYFAEIWIIIGFSRGIVDYAINNAINISLSSFRGDRGGEDLKVKNMYALYRFIYALAYIPVSFMVGYVDYRIILLVSLIILILSSISYVFFLVYNYIDKKEKMQEVKDIKTEFEQNKIDL